MLGFTSIQGWAYVTSCGGSGYGKCSRKDRGVCFTEECNRYVNGKRRVKDKGVELGETFVMNALKFRLVLKDLNSNFNFRKQAWLSSGLKSDDRGHILFRLQDV